MQRIAQIVKISSKSRYPLKNSNVLKVAQVFPSIKNHWLNFPLAHGMLVLTEYPLVVSNTGSNLACDGLKWTTIKKG